MLTHVPVQALASCTNRPLTRLRESDYHHKSMYQASVSENVVLTFLSAEDSCVLTLDLDLYCFMPSTTSVKKFGHQHAFVGLPHSVPQGDWSMATERGLECLQIVCIHKVPCLQAHNRFACTSFVTSCTAQLQVQPVQKSSCLLSFW